MHSSGGPGNRVVALRADESSSSSEEMDTATAEAKPPVRCPDCDLCDGSGRYVVEIEEHVLRLRLCQWSVELLVTVTTPH